VDNEGDAALMLATLAVMSTLAQRRRIEARIRRIASLVISALCAVVLVANFVLFLERPSTFFTDGAMGLAPISALLVHALWWTPVAATAAVLVVGTMPEAAKGVPPVDQLPGRLPMMAGVVALCAAVACIAVPVVIFVASIMAVVLAAVL
jgi:hypothetical protein